MTYDRKCYEPHILRHCGVNARTEHYLPSTTKLSCVSRVYLLNPRQSQHDLPTVVWIDLGGILRVAPDRVPFQVDCVELLQMGELFKVLPCGQLVVIELQQVNRENNVGCNRPEG